MTQWRLGSLALYCLYGAIAAAPCVAAQPVEPAVEAANRFLATLSEAQRAKVVYAWSDDAQRARWSNFPTGFVPRGGLSLADMSGPQRAAALALLKVVLSPKGYEKVDAIRMADDDFKANGSKRGPRGNGPPPPGAAPGRGPPPRGDAMFGADLYYVSFVGKPSLQLPWMLQFGGHHLALNITMSGSTGIMTPSLTGAQPAVFTVNGRTIRPLGAESDKGLALVQSLAVDQRKRAILNYRVADLVLGPGQDAKRIAPEGLPVSAMNAQQKALLTGVIEEWVGIMNDAAAEPRMAQLKADLNDTWFAWSGPLDFSQGTNITAYYRIQGPHLVIEYAPQSDEPANHVHTIYRDPTNDYGKRLDGAQ